MWRTIQPRLKVSLGQVVLVVVLALALGGSLGPGGLDSSPGLVSAELPDRDRNIFLQVLRSILTQQRALAMAAGQQLQQQPQHRYARSSRDQQQQQQQHLQTRAGQQQQDQIMARILARTLRDNAAQGRRAQTDDYDGMHALFSLN